jgi:hypothetical protein
MIINHRIKNTLMFFSIKKYFGVFWALQLLRVLSKSSSAAQSCKTVPRDVSLNRKLESGETTLGSFSRVNDAIS